MPSGSDKTAGAAASALMSSACNSRLLLLSQLKGSRFDGTLARWMRRTSEIVATVLPRKLTSAGREAGSKDCLVFKCANI